MVGGGEGRGEEGGGEGVRLYGWIFPLHYIMQRKIHDGNSIRVIINEIHC